MAVTKCANCGKEIDDSFKFCPGCGSAVNTASITGNDEQRKTSSTVDPTPDTIIAGVDSAGTIINGETEKNSIIQMQNHNKKHIWTVLAIVFVVSTALLAFGIFEFEMTKRSLFASEKDMKAAVQGVYTEYDSRGYGERQVVITSDNITIKYYFVPDGYSYNIEKWDYKHGKIKAYKNIIILHNGNIKYDNSVFSPGGTLATVDEILNLSPSSGSSYSRPASTPSPTILDDLSFSGKLKHSGSYAVYEGKVKNNSNKTYYYVKMRVQFKSGLGEIIDTDWTYAIGSEGLRPNEQTTYQVSVKDPGHENTYRPYDQIRQVSLEITDFEVK